MNQQEGMPPENEPLKDKAGNGSRAKSAISKTDKKEDRPHSNGREQPEAELEKKLEQEFGPRLGNLDAGLDEELEAAMGGLSATDLYGDLSARPKKQAAPADQSGRKKGKVVAVHAADVFVDVGGRSQGLLPLSQFPEGPPTVGSEIDVHIERYDPAEGILLLSRTGAAVHADWSSVAEGMIVEARVTQSNKGGLAVDVNGIRGFMPISQIDLYRVEDAEQFVNQKLKCLVVEVNAAERNLVLSRRALLEKEREENRERLWAELAEGQVREAVVRSVRDFGAFVDLGGVDALLHISEMSWQRVQDVSKIVKPGETVKVVVLRIDRERRKVGVGLKQLMASPWDQAALTYPPNSVAKGKVTKLMDFGAFVELEPGIEGLVHISELAPQRVHRVKDIVQEGQEVQVMILKVEAEARKLSLSIKAAAAKPAPEPTEEEEEETPSQLRPSKPRTTPLRGGLGT
jgi:small subunit ribosomal protein S1